MKLEQLQEGAFCQLKIGRWDASIRLPKDKLGSKVPKEIIRATQDLIEDRTLLKDLATIRRSAKGYLFRNSLPFEVDGIYWIRKDKISEIDEKFAELKVEYGVRLDKLIRNYIKMKNDFRKKYPDYYVGKKYPTSSQLREKFYFRWNFFHFAIPDKETKILSPKVYKREQEKFKNMIARMEEMTITMIGNLLIKRAQKLSKQCNSGKINGGTVASIERFMKRWDELWDNYVDEDKMRSIMKSLKKQIKGMSVERLKGNEDFRNKMEKTLEGIIGNIQNVPGFELKRNLDI